MKHILKCQKCEQYTMQKEHCGKIAISSKPMRFSLGKFAEHRQKARKVELEKEGLL